MSGGLELLKSRGGCGVATPKLQPMARGVVYQRIVLRFGGQTADVGKERRWTIVDVESLERVEGEELK